VNRHLAAVFGFYDQHARSAWASPQSWSTDYVFVNLFAKPVGQPLGYPAAHELIGRIAERTGIASEHHQGRHRTSRGLDAHLGPQAFRQPGTGLGPRSVRLTLGRPKAALEMAVDEGKLVRNVARLVRPPEYITSERETCERL
jgi:hypothetical protein